MPRLAASSSRACVNNPHPSPAFLPSAAPLATAPRRLQNFLYEKELQGKPVYVMGISAGAAFAVKVRCMEEGGGGGLRAGGSSGTAAEQRWVVRRR